MIVDAHLDHRGLLPTRWRRWPTRPPPASCLRAEPGRGEGP